MEEWLTTYEAARLANLDPDYIRKLVRSEKIKARKWGQSWQVHRASLLAYMKKFASVRTFTVHAFPGFLS
jgi:excisionase family DNA binding protein